MEEEAEALQVNSDGFDEFFFISHLQACRKNSSYERSTREICILEKTRQIVAVKSVLTSFIQQVLWTCLQITTSI